MAVSDVVGNKIIPFLPSNGLEFAFQLASLRSQVLWKLDGHENVENVKNVENVNSHLFQHLFEMDISQSGELFLDFVQNLGPLREKRQRHDKIPGNQLGTFL